jgi:hypothetical protein
VKEAIKDHDPYLRQTILAMKKWRNSRFKVPSVAAAPTATATVAAGAAAATRKPTSYLMECIAMQATKDAAAAALLAGIRGNDSDFAAVRLLMLTCFQRIVREFSLSNSCPTVPDVSDPTNNIADAVNSDVRKQLVLYADAELRAAVGMFDRWAPVPSTPRLSSEAAGPVGVAAGSMGKEGTICMPVTALAPMHGGGGAGKSTKGKEGSKVKELSGAVAPTSKQSKKQKKKTAAAAAAAAAAPKPPPASVK